MAIRVTREERRERTREELLAAADERFVTSGYHATTLDQIAADAGYTKGAVYSNFASKEDLFFAVYERRVDRGVAEVERVLAEYGPLEGIERITAATATRQGRDDGWLAVFVEFWAHVVRHPELRERFAALHVRIQEPFATAVRRLGELDVDARELAVAMMAMDIGLALERFVQPDVVDRTLGLRMSRIVLDAVDGRGRT
jgi:AcrR family transcriptional regulator